MDIANNQIDQLWALYLPLGQICVFLDDLPKSFAQLHTYFKVL